MRPESPRSRTRGSAIRLHRDPLAWGLAVLVLLAGVALVWGRGQVVFQEDSRWGQVRVEERRDGVRELYLGTGAGRQTAMDPSHPARLELPYTRVMLAAVAALPDTGRVLFVGLGGGALPTWVRNVLPGARIDVVEINPVVAKAARAWFGFREDRRMTLHLADGRAYMEEAPDHAWDLVVLDAFSGGEVPRALTTREFLAQVRRVVRPGGVVAANLHTSSPPYRDMLATWTAVFPAVALLPVPTRRQVILLAAEGEELLAPGRLAAAGEALAARAPAAEGLADLVRRRLRPAEPGGGSVLEDEAGR